MKDISLHILDIVQNSITAGANRVDIEIDENRAQNRFNVTITDNGCGMDKDMIEKVTDPYYTSRKSRNVGLGIPLLKQSVEQTGGIFDICSTLGKGTTVKACFINDNIDCPPLGDMVGVLVIIVTANPTLDFVYKHKVDDKEIVFSTFDVKNILEDISIADPGIRTNLKKIINDDLAEIGRD